MNQPKKNLLFARCVFLIAFGTVAAHGQNPIPAPAAAPAGKAQVPVLVAKLRGNFTSKSGKVGDTIVANTLRPWKLPDGTDLPKGSKLIGTVSSVRSRQAGNGNSVVTFRFDKAELKGGGVAPIHGLVVAIGPGLGPKQSIGANSVIGRGGVGSDPGLDPRTGIGRPGARDEDDIPMGSSLDGVALGHHMDADWTTALEGIHRDIQLDSDIVIKVEFK